MGKIYSHSIDYALEAFEINLERNLPNPILHDETYYRIPIIPKSNIGMMKFDEQYDAEIRVRAKVFRKIRFQNLDARIVWFWERIN